MASINVISQLERKNGSSQDIFKLGPELRYISSLPTSNNNNFEEQILMGTDRIVKSQKDGNINKQVIEFRRETDTENYYILEIDDYGESGGGSSEGIYVDNNGAIHLATVMTYINNAAHLDEYSENITYSDNGFHFNYTPSTLLLMTYRLKYNDGQDIINISTKDVYQSYETENNVTIKVIKEIITNLL